MHVVVLDRDSNAYYCTDDDDDDDDDHDDGDHDDDDEEGAGWDSNCDTPRPLSDQSQGQLLL